MFHFPLKYVDTTLHCRIPLNIPMLWRWNPPFLTLNFVSSGHGQRLWRLRLLHRHRALVPWKIIGIFIRNQLHGLISGNQTWKIHKIQHLWIFEMSFPLKLVMGFSIAIFAISGGCIVPYCGRMVVWISHFHVWTKNNSPDGYWFPHWDGWQKYGTTAQLSRLLSFLPCELTMARGRHGERSIGHKWVFMLSSFFVNIPAL